MMIRSFVETLWFTKDLPDYLTEEGFAEFQTHLLDNPRIGTVVPGSGGLRKVRYADPMRGKGKRGGIRIYYLDVPEKERVYLLDIHGKDEKEDLSPGELKVLKSLVTEIRKSCREPVKKKAKK